MFEFVLCANVVCSTNHQPSLHADSLKMHTQAWICMQTACKFNVEPTEPLVWDCYMKKSAKSLVELTSTSLVTLELTKHLVWDCSMKKPAKFLVELRLG